MLHVDPSKHNSLALKHIVMYRTLCGKVQCAQEPSLPAVLLSCCHLFNLCFVTFVWSITNHNSLACNHIDMDHHMPIYCIEKCSFQEPRALTHSTCPITDTCFIEVEKKQQQKKAHTTICYMVEWAFFCVYLIL